MFGMTSAQIHLAVNHLPVFTALLAIGDPAARRCDPRRQPAQHGLRSGRGGWIVCAARLLQRRGRRGDRRGPPRGLRIAHRASRGCRCTGLGRDPRRGRRSPPPLCWPSACGASRPSGLLFAFTLVAALASTGLMARVAHLGGQIRHDEIRSPAASGGASPWRVRLRRDETRRAASAIESRGGRSGEPGRLATSCSAVRTVQRAATLERLEGVAAGAGLSSTEVARRRDRYGANDIVEARPASWRHLARETARDPMLWFLAGTGTTYIVLGQHLEGAVLLRGVGAAARHGRGAALSDRRIDRGAQRAAGKPRTVERDGGVAEVAATELVPGDLVHLGPANGFQPTG